jgi:predicted membrane protein
MILVLIHILIAIVIAAIVFWAIDKYVRDRRLSNLLKLLVILICIAAILPRVLALIGVSF